MSYWENDYIIGCATAVWPKKRNLSLKVEHSPYNIFSKIEDWRPDAYEYEGESISPKVNT